MSRSNKLNPIIIRLTIIMIFLLNMEVDRNIKVYKEENLILYADGEDGFWVIDLVDKNFKLLNLYLEDEDIKNVGLGKYIYGHSLYNSIAYRKERYKDRLIILNAIDQLSQKEQVIYKELKNKQGDGVVVCPNHNGPIFYGPYLQPLKYLLK